MPKCDFNKVAFENMQQFYRRTPMPKCDFNKVAMKCDFNKVAFSNFIETALRHGCYPVNLLHIFRTPFPENTSVWLLLYQLFSPKALHNRCLIGF